MINYSKFKPYPTDIIHISSRNDGLMHKVVSTKTNGWWGFTCCRGIKVKKKECLAKAAAPPQEETSTAVPKYVESPPPTSLNSAKTARPPQKETSTTVPKYVDPQTKPQDTTSLTDGQKDILKKIGNGELCILPPYEKIAGPICDGYRGTTLDLPLATYNSMHRWSYYTFDGFKTMGGDQGLYDVLFDIKYNDTGFVAAPTQIYTKMNTLKMQEDLQGIIKEHIIDEETTTMLAIPFCGTQDTQVGISHVALVVIEINRSEKTAYITGLDSLGFSENYGMKELITCAKNQLRLSELSVSSLANNFKQNNQNLCGLHMMRNIEFAYKCHTAKTSKTSPSLYEIILSMNNDETPKGELGPRKKEELRETYESAQALINQKRQQLYLEYLSLDVDTRNNALIFMITSLDYKNRFLITRDGQKLQ